MQTQLRLFFAIPLPDAVRQQIHRLMQDLRQQFPAKTIRWIPLNNLHITLRFIGACASNQLLPLISATQDALATYPAFSFELSKLQFFPPRHPHILILNVAPNNELTQLNQILEQTLQALGFAAELRAFSPHLTLARWQKPPANSVLPTQLPHISSIWVEQIILYNSQLSTSPPCHEPLAHFNLV